MNLIDIKVCKGQQGPNVAAERTRCALGGIGECRPEQENMGGHTEWVV